MSLQPLAARVVVADAGPLIALARLEGLVWLGRLFQQVQVPDVVLAECLAKPDRMDAQRIQQAVSSGGLIVCQAQPVTAAGLDDGERSAIGRALEIQAGLLVDDRAARQYAVSIGIDVVGTLGVLLLAKRNGLLLEVRTSIEQLRAGGYWLGDAAVARVLAAAGEGE